MHGHMIWVVFWSLCTLFACCICSCTYTAYESCHVEINTMSFTLDYVKNCKGIKVAHLNARSLINHFDELYICFLDGKLDIVIFTESWLHANCSDSLITVQGYDHYRLDRQLCTPAGAVKRGGGIIIYVRSELNVIDWPSLDSSDGDLEIVSLSYKLRNYKKVNITAIYRPPSGCVQAAVDRIVTVVESIRLTSSGDTVIIGDLNVDLLDDNVHTRKVKQICDACRVHQTLSEPTRITLKSSTLKDHIYTNAAHKFCTGVVNCNISDHLPVFLVLKKSRNKTQYRTVFGRTYRDFNDQQFTETLTTESYRVGTKEVLSGEEAANEINGFFALVSAKLSANFPEETPIETTRAISPNCNFVEPLSLRRVTEQINAIDPNKSSGLRDVPTRLLKIALQTVPNQVTYLLNLCLERAVFPQSWKRAITVCIPKCDDVRNVNNLRPISLLRIIGKTLEYFLNETIIKHLESNGLLDDRQMGFRRGRHCT